MKSKKLSLAVLAILGIAGLASAASITWSSATAETEGGYGQVLSVGLFDTSGTFVSAENVGGAATSFDGISFAAGTVAWDGSGPYFHEVTPLSLDGAYMNAGAGTVSLTGLTHLQEYRVQALIFDGRSDYSISGRTVEFDGIDQGQYANGEFNVTYGAGLLVTGTFIADATTTQDFTIEAFFDDGSSNVSKGGQLNALTLYAIPEPATLGMVAAFGGAILFIRRKLVM